MLASSVITVLMADQTPDKSMLPAVLGMVGVLAFVVFAVIYVGKAPLENTQARGWTAPEVLQVLKVKPVKTAGSVPGCTLIPDDPAVEVLKNLNQNGHSSTQQSVLMDATVSLPVLSSRLIKSEKFDAVAAHNVPEKRGGPTSQYLISRDAARRIILLQQQARCLTVVILQAGTAIEDVVAAQVKFAPEDAPPPASAETHDAASPIVPGEVPADFEVEPTGTDLVEPETPGPSSAETEDSAGPQDSAEDPGDGSGSDASME